MVQSRQGGGSPGVSAKSLDFRLGKWGLEAGYYQMIGGVEIEQHLDPIFRAFVPGVDSAPRTLQGVSVDSRACCDASMAQDEAIGCAPVIARVTLTGGFPRNRRTPCK